MTSDSTTNPQPITWVLKNQDATQYTYTLYVDLDTIGEMVEKEVQNQAKNFRLAGFMPGKVPLSLVRSQVGPKVRYDKLNEEINSAIRSISAQDNLNVSSTSLEVDNNSNDKTMVLSLVLNCMPKLPEIEIPKDKISLDVAEPEINQADLDEMKKELLKNSVRYEVEEGAISEHGDMILIDFEGKLKEKDNNGKITKVEFPGNSATKLQVTIGENQFIPGFEDGLIGLKKEDKKTLELKFPDDYHEKDLAGKEVDFEVEVHEVMKPHQPETFDEGLLSRLGVKDTAELEENLKRRMMFEGGILKRIYMKKKLFDKLNTTYKNVEIPGELLQKEIENLKSEAEQNGGTAANPLLNSDDKLQSAAERRIRIGIVLNNAARIYNVTVTEQDIEHAKEAERMRGSNTDFTKDPQLFARVQASIMEEKIVDKLVEELCIINTKNIPYNECRKLYMEELNEGNA